MCDNYILRSKMPSLEIPRENFASKPLLATLLKIHFRFRDNSLKCGAKYS